MEKHVTKKVFQKVIEILDVTEYALVKRTGKKPTTIARYAKGINSITLEKLEEICDSVDLKLEIIITKNEKNTPHI